jgi:Zn-dependent M28 family amino/carboxypeptidase
MRFSVWTFAMGLIFFSACASVSSLVPDELPTGAATMQPGPISLDRYRANVLALASAEMEGRRIGTEGGRRAVSFMANGLRAAGAVPAPGMRGFVQEYEHHWHGRTRGANVIAVLPGQDPALAREVIVVMAHHDHLGFNRDSGCPRDKKSKKLNPGANDNATGSAALLELAHSFGSRSDELRRTMVFLSTDGEECGCTGVKHYVYAAPAFPLSQTSYALNIDQIGEGGWLVTHNRGNSGKRDADCEVDGEVFARKRIPAQTFVGDNRYYHSSRDTLDRVNFPKAFEVVREARDLLWKRVQAPGG